MAKEYPIVDSVESFETALARVRAAQKVYATYTQEQVDKISSSCPRREQHAHPAGEDGGGRNRHGRGGR